MPITTCIANMKGGVGKTTLATNLAYYVFKNDMKVLLIDNDPQFNATVSFFRQDEYVQNIKDAENFKTIYDIYESPPRGGNRVQSQIDPSKFLHRRWYFRKGHGQLDILASRIELYDTLRNPSSKEYVLSKFIEKYCDDYDYIFIDCPPTPSVLTSSAFAASDYALIPVAPGYFAAMGLPQFLNTLNDFKNRLLDPNDIKPLGVVFTRVPRQQNEVVRGSIQNIKKSLDKLNSKIPVFDSKMTTLSVYEKALARASPVSKLSGRGAQGRSKADQEMQQLVAEFFEKIENA